MFAAIIGLTLISGLVYFLHHYFSKAEDTSKASILSNDITRVAFDPLNGHLFLLYTNSNVWGNNNELESTYLIEINQNGDMIKKEIIQDPHFGPISIDQKSTQPNMLYASLNGGQYANHFYTFDMKERRFQKETIDYFQHDVMLDSVGHQGKDTWFKTITSYKTGTQRYVEGKGFSLTISNYDEKTMYETPPEHFPTPSPLLETEDKIAYVSAGSDLADEEEAGMIFLDRVTGEAEVYRGKVDPYEYTPLHTDGKNTYFADSNGNMYRIDAKGKMIEKSFEVIENAYNNSSDPIRMINEQEGYQIISKYYPETSTEELILVKWTFGKDFTVEKMDLPYWNDNNLYRYLYHDLVLKHSYLVEMDAEEETETGRLLIVDEKMNLINAIRIEDPLGLDFVAE